MIRNYFRDELLAYLYMRPQYDKKLESRIKNISYTDKGIGKVVTALNGLTAQSVPSVSNSNKKSLSFYAGGGAIYSTMTFSGDNTYLKGVD